jgi:hypothetical protein
MPAARFASIAYGPLCCYILQSYLIAIVVGDLASKDIGPRSKVWTGTEYSINPVLLLLLDHLIVPNGRCQTEREKLEAAAWEFANTGTLAALVAVCLPQASLLLGIVIIIRGLPEGCRGAAYSLRVGSLRRAPSSLQVRHALLACKPSLLVLTHFTVVVIFSASPTVAWRYRINVLPFTTLTSSMALFATLLLLIPSFSSTEPLPHLCDADAAGR